MAYTDAQARAYYNTLTPEQKAQVDASGGPSIAWFTNAVNAGVPAAIRAAGGGRSEEGGEDDNQMPASGNTADWLGKRTPTPSELRQYARESGWSEDFARFSDRQLAAWLGSSWDQTANKFRNSAGLLAEKPTESVNGQGGPEGGGGGGGGYGGGGYGVGDVPQFNWTRFEAPSYESAMADPGYQFALKQGADSLQQSALSKGVGRTSGTLKDLIGYGQDMAATQYGNVYNRALSSWGANYQGEKDAFAPQYGAWQTRFGAGENRWSTQYGGDLAKYLNRENNIYGLLNAPAPTY